MAQHILNRPQSHIKFIHCRNKDSVGQVTPKGGLTIAYVLNQDFKVVGYAGARCNPLDHFNKHVGRQKSAGRLLSANYYTECPEIDEDLFIQQAHDGYVKAF